MLKKLAAVLLPNGLLPAFSSSAERAESFQLTVTAAATADSSQQSRVVNQNNVGMGIAKPLLHRIHRQAIRDQMSKPKCWRAWRWNVVLASFEMLAHLFKIKALAAADGKIKGSGLGQPGVVCL